MKYLIPILTIVFFSSNINAHTLREGLYLKYYDPWAEMRYLGCLKHMARNQGNYKEKHHQSHKAKSLIEIDVICKLYSTKQIERYEDKVEDLYK